MSAVTPLPWQNANIDDTKRQFAALIYARPNNPVERMNAARQIYPRQDQVPAALAVANDWPHDPIVIAELDKLAKVADQDLPTVEQLARDIYNIAADNAKAVDDRLKAFKLYAEVRGFLQKPAGTVVNNNLMVDARRAYILPAEQSVEEWEAETIEQQAALVHDAAF